MIPIGTNTNRGGLPVATTPPLPKTAPTGLAPTGEARAMRSTRTSRLRPIGPLAVPKSYHGGTKEPSPFPAAGKPPPPEDTLSRETLLQKLEASSGAAGVRLLLELWKSGAGREATRVVPFEVCLYLRGSTDLLALARSTVMQHPEIDLQGIAEVAQWTGEGGAGTRNLWPLWRVLRQLESIQTFSSAAPAAERPALSRALLRPLPPDPFGLRTPEPLSEIALPTQPDAYPDYFTTLARAFRPTAPRWRPGPPVSRSEVLGALACNARGMELNNPLGADVRICVTTDETSAIVDLAPGESKVLAVRADTPCSLRVLNARGEESKDVHLNLPSSIAGQDANAMKRWGPSEQPLKLVASYEQTLPVLYPDPSDASLALRETTAIYGTRATSLPDKASAEDLRRIRDKDSAKIPPLSHTIWLGSLLPERYFPNLETFRRLNPEQTMVLWTDRTAAELEGTAMAHFCDARGIQIINVEAHAIALTQRAGLHEIYALYRLNRQPAAMSDILRVLLQKYLGGTYADHDRACHMPLEWLRENYQLVIPWEDKVGLANDFSMSIPGHPFWDAVIEYIKNAHTRPFEPQRQPQHEKDAAVILSTGPGAWLEVSRRWRDTGGTALLSGNQVGTGHERRGTSWTHGQEDGATWILKRRKERGEPLIQGRAETRKEHARRLAACYLMDLHRHGSFFPEYYADEFSEHADLKNEVHALTRAVLLGTDIGSGTAGIGPRDTNGPP
jgi:mannosyltransferase OCH1-like enzyme